MKNEAKIIGTILGIVLFIVLVAGATYAYLLLKSETDLTTGTGKFSIDYKIVQDITATNLSPSTNKSGGLIGKVQAKLSNNSLAGNFNIYITPKTIDGLNTNEALKYANEHSLKIIIATKDKEVIVSDKLKDEFVFNEILTKMGYAYINK